jgi:hypothetical protein
MATLSHLRLALRQASELHGASKAIQVAQTSGTNASSHQTVSFATRALNQTFTVHNRAASTLSSRHLSAKSLLSPIISNNNTLVIPKQQANNFSSSNSDHALSTKATSDPFTEATSDKGILAKLWDRYSFEGQTKRIVLGERLFRAAQIRANDV